MNWRTIVAAVLVLIGVVWIAQGTNVLKGSAMTGVRFWAFAGAVALVAGIVLAGWEIRARRGPR